MPAPAVIPAPKAYINAVAVKGFVVELGADRVNGGVLSLWEELPAVLAAREHQKRTSRNCFLPLFACNVCWRASVFITVTNEGRLKQSFDLN